VAKIDAVWGIDIGQCGVKALRCRVNEQPDRLTAEAFDYIEYPKILSQPEADPVELIRDALKQFLSRNSVKGDRVAISVPGQNGLARFIKLPPVESRKVPDIVKYEARQQIPFPLDDVVWDYQQMAGGSEEDGFVLETEVGLFAMKREQVARALSPFDDAGIEVDIVQLTPLALYNYIAFDQLHKLPPPDQYDPESPPDSLVVLSLGTETTDLVVTNGYRVWQRSIPLGGSHFTKALSKELKLTYPKAEHMKRNAAQAENPKAIFQAMRPVFNDLVTEVQRSIGYFTNIDRRAKIARIVSLGSAMKLPGLQRYLQQNLGMEIDRVEAFRGLSGSSVVEAPIFKENILAFGVCYGLCVQGLRDARIKTNLIPPEIVTDRMIRAKKPWAVAAAACLLIGLAASFGGHWKAWNSVHDDKFGEVKSKADAVASESSNLVTQFTEQETQLKTVNTIGDVLVSNIDGRLMWLEVLKAINECLPHDPEGKQPAAIEERNELHITQVQCQKLPNLAMWYSMVSEWDPDKPKDFVAAAAPMDPAAGGDPCNPCATACPVPCAVPADAGAVDPAAGGDPAAAAPGGYGPSGEGWVFQITGYHYHNKEGDRENFGMEYVRRAFLDRLKSEEIKLMAIGNRPAESVTTKELGIGYPVLINPGRVYDHWVPDENAEPL
jgi:type IV pilus assembly protein PilM